MDCHNCRFSRPIHGDSHLECRAIRSPALRLSAALNPYGLPDQFIRLNPHGVKHGWALWPLNFDPIWVDYCAFFIDRGKPDDSDGPLRERPDNSD